MHYREITGAALDPAAAYFLIRGVKTLYLRIRQQNESALRIARYLADHAAVERVYYPGLTQHPGHDIATRQMSGYGGVLSFLLKVTSARCARFFHGSGWRTLRPNLGAVETIAGPPATTSHVECTPEERSAMGIPEGLVRYSVGIEDSDDLLDDLEQALAD